jgi:hypothetical protein
MQTNMAQYFNYTYRNRDSTTFQSAHLHQLHRKPVLLDVYD